MDGESGGMVLSELSTNIPLCIAEKTRKVKKLQSRYPEWWLVLTDHIGFRLDDLDRQQFRICLDCTLVGSGRTSESG